MHWSLWECPHLNFNWSPNSFRNSHQVVCSIREVVSGVNRLLPGNLTSVCLWGVTWPKVTQDLVLLSGVLLKTALSYPKKSCGQRYISLDGPSSPASVAKRVYFDTEVGLTMATTTPTTKPIKQRRFPLFTFTFTFHLKLTNSFPTNGCRLGFGAATQNSQKRTPYNETAFDDARKNLGSNVVPGVPASRPPESANKREFDQNSYTMGGFLPK